MTVDTFITENRGKILLCGQSCIGKSYFAGKKLKGKSTFYKWPFDDFWPKAPGKWEAWKDLTITKERKVIMIGAPYYVWKERVKERAVTNTNKHMIKKNTMSVEEFKEKYVRCIRKLHELNIPCIFVDNRNDFTILEESSFIAMLQESG